jgi:hypothetical protein
MPNGNQESVSHLMLIKKCIPRKAMINPAMASLASFPLKKVIITIQIGKIAFIIAPTTTDVFYAPST